MGSVERFTLLMASDEGAIEIDEAALVLASVFRPDLVVEEWSARLDEFAAGCDADIASVTRRLFGELGFDGNRCVYYDVANSWLDVVIERRTGIPITLSIVVMAVARRVGLDVRGVGLPSHFLAWDVESDTYIDAFGGGRLLDRAGVAALFDSLHGGQQAFSESMLATVGPRLIVRRMLNNLVNIADLTNDRALRVEASKLRSILPDATTADRLDLAGALLSRGEVLRAADVLDAAAAEAPDHEHDSLARFASEVRARLN